ncbi:Thiamine pyrophosphokinase [Phytophthora megakarya]|uniref:Thiamine pyrophosphokinase n=1 Tax=Phytophthora megakarya TaxID=4795 RepID=A0A225WZN6_9STRA|nr:Thiamine pyrophosphokinase [Phytophthora megakarya]
MVPTKQHSNGFWSDPTAVPRLAVLLLNASFDSWTVVKGGVGLEGPALFWNMWSHAQLTVCADGGANRLFDRSVELGVQHFVAPNYIKGDLDSLRADVREFFSTEGTTVLQDQDQNSNDLNHRAQEVQWRHGSPKFSIDDMKNHTWPA